MSESAAHIQRKLGNAHDLQSVVRTMKALAASNIGQFEKSVQGLGDYSHSVEVGIGACLRARSARPKSNEGMLRKDIIAIVLGSDQGLVGQFNDVVSEYAKTKLLALEGNALIWSIGERVHSRLDDLGLSPAKLFEVPNSVKSITSLIGKILLSYDDEQSDSDMYIFFNRSSTGALYAPTSVQLLPLDDSWEKNMMRVEWPTALLPQLMGPETLLALIREYLFISMFRASAESLKAENASRLAAMQRADKNISDLIENLTSTFNHLRQSQIDEELFDVVSGFENMAKDKLAKG